MSYLFFIHLKSLSEFPLISSSLIIRECVVKFPMFTNLPTFLHLLSSNFIYFVVVEKHALYCFLACKFIEASVSWPSDWSVPENVAHAVENVYSLLSVPQKCYRLMQ